MVARYFNLYRLAAIVLITCCSCGCGAPPVVFPPAALTQTPTRPPTATPSPSPTPNFKATQDAAPTATIWEAASAALAEAKEWPVTFADNFDDPASSLDAGWELGAVKGDSFSADIQVIDGRYQLDISPSAGFIGVHKAESAQQQVGDFYLAVDVQKLQGAEQAGCGLAFRWMDHHNYSLYLITSPFEFLAAELRDNRWARSLWKPTSQIKTDQPNRLSMVAKDGLFYFYINDTFVFHLDDTHPGSGGYPALAYQVGNKGVKVVLAFDNFEVREPPRTFRGAASTPRPDHTPTVPQ